MIDDGRYAVGAIANYMLRRGSREGVRITHLKLQKLVYIAYGWATLYLPQGRLFDSKIEAWRHGPVIRDLWHEFKAFGNKPIGDARAFEFDVDRMETSIPQVPAEDKETHGILNLVWLLYGPQKAWRLVDKTHEPGTPWSQAVARWNGRFGGEIKHDDIRAHFSDLFSAMLVEPPEQVVDRIIAGEQVLA